MQALHINGNDLSFDEVRQVVYERRAVLLSPDAREAVERERDVIEARIDDPQPVYAINTGVGKLSDVRIAPEQTRALQVNLLRSHAVGVGRALTEQETRGMMLLRANSLAKGYSGIRAVVIDALCEMLNRGVHPVVPSQGSVGASGGLAPLAHLALVLIGEGEAVYSPTARSRKGRRAGESGEGAKMSGAHAMKRAEIRPLVLEAKEAISLINGTQAMLALGALALLAAETMVESADVLGALTLDALHGTDVAFDPRIQLVRPQLNEGLPAFLAREPGLNSGFMMAQVTAAALVAENRVLSHPASVNSITTSGNKEDFVSMGMTSALKLKRIVANTRTVLAIEALAAAQALDFLKPLSTSSRGQAAHAAIRSVSPVLDIDRSLAADFERVGELIASGKIAEVLR